MSTSARGRLSVVPPHFRQKKRRRADKNLIFCHLCAINLTITASGSNRFAQPGRAFHPPIKRVTFPVILCYNEGNVPLIDSLRLPTMYNEGNVSLIDSLRLPTMYNEGNVPLIDSLRLPTMYKRQHGMNRPPNGW